MLRSLSITALVSTLFALLFPAHWIIVFALVTVLQILFFLLFNTIYGNYILLQAENTRLEQIKELAKNNTILECPCSEKFRQQVEVSLDKDRIYDCGKCKKPIKASVFVKNVLVTEPLLFNDRS